MTARPSVPTTDQPKSFVEPPVAAAAATLSQIARAMTDRVMVAIEAAKAELGVTRGLADDDLWWAIFSGIARHLTDNLAADLAADVVPDLTARLTTVEKRRDVLAMPPDPDRFAKLEQAKRDHRDWMRRNRSRISRSNS